MIQESPSLKYEPASEPLNETMANGDGAGTSHTLEFEGLDSAEIRGVGDQICTT